MTESLVSLLYIFKSISGKKNKTFLKAIMASDGRRGDSGKEHTIALSPVPSRLNGCHFISLMFFCHVEQRVTPSTIASSAEYLFLQAFKKGSKFSSSPILFTPISDSAPNNPVKR